MYTRKHVTHPGRLDLTCSRSLTGEAISCLLTNIGRNILQMQVRIPI